MGALESPAPQQTGQGVFRDGLHVLREPLDLLGAAHGVSASYSGAKPYADAEGSGGTRIRSRRRAAGVSGAFAADGAPPWLAVAGGWAERRFAASHRSEEAAFRVESAWSGKVGGVAFRPVPYFQAGYAEVAGISVSQFWIGDPGNGLYAGLRTGRERLDLDLRGTVYREKAYTFRGRLDSGERNKEASLGLTGFSERLRLRYRQNLKEKDERRWRVRGALGAWALTASRQTGDLEQRSPLFLEGKERGLFRYAVRWQENRAALAWKPPGGPEARLYYQEKRSRAEGDGNLDASDLAGFWGTLGAGKRRFTGGGRLHFEQVGVRLAAPPKRRWRLAGALEYIRADLSGAVAHWQPVPIFEIGELDKRRETAPLRGADLLALDFGVTHNRGPWRLAASVRQLLPLRVERAEDGGDGNGGGGDNLSWETVKKNAFEGMRWSLRTEYRF